ncbi:DUF6262 family protein [Mycobacteroides abscessus]|uniref:DUF6262 family protein n=1 Tax=Mycobacteroides abscessus TaxID=36809 RepID=UPI000C26B582|nr:DUF6262 family protein [Mycobacteroides abscessus]RIS61415.1 hypothetical protein D2E46_20195 [Mycobacteroides abscessus]
MTAFDREARLARLSAASAARRAETESRARRAIMRLENAGEPVTFVAVARTGAVSTSFLYQHRELRSIIEKHRSSIRTRQRPDVESPSAASLRTKLQVALRRNRELVEEIAVLRTENEALRSRVLELGHSRSSTQTG